MRGKPIIIVASRKQRKQIAKAESSSELTSGCGGCAAILVLIAALLTQVV